MRIQDVHTICKQNNIRFLPTLLRHLYWRFVCHANVLLSPRVCWLGNGKVNICGRLMIGFDNSILSHSNVPTTIKLSGNLITNGTVRLQRGSRIEVGDAATLKPVQFNQIFIDAITTNHAPCPRKYVDYKEVFTRWWWLESMGFKDNLSFVYNMLKMRGLQHKVFGIWFKFQYRRYIETKLFNLKWYKYKLGIK